MTQKQQTENHRELSGKRIVVLGGSSGIGLAVAQQAVDQGATAIIASSNAERVKQAVATLDDGKAEGHALDLSKEGDIHSFFQKIGDFDHLVFTAGDTLQLNELAATDLTEARHAFELRFWAALAAVKYASPHLRKDGSIVLTTGVAGQRPHKGWTVAASVCGTIEALTRALAVELAPIRVNAVCPGVVRTNLWQNMNADAREQLYESVGKSLLVGRVGEACEIARAYLFLIQEGYSTGQIVVLDGGAVLV
ncbi:MAG TPA: SDR family oxidoreductase [Candidatus Dormibacteraeota bacterium]|nr:SDR family oxidoreductase [Candidatus Dormibacteraeota bacterium]